MLALTRNLLPELGEGKQSKDTGKNKRRKQNKLGNLKDKTKIRLKTHLVEVDKSLLIVFTFPSLQVLQDDEQLK